MWWKMYISLGYGILGDGWEELDTIQKRSHQWPWTQDVDIVVSKRISIHPWSIMTQNVCMNVYFRFTDTLGNSAMIMIVQFQL